MDNKSNEKLNIALIEPNTNVAKKLKELFEKQREVVSVEFFDKFDDLKKKLKNDSVNAVIVNIFDYTEGIEIIDWIKETKIPIPVCILGTEAQLATFDGMSDTTKNRFRHYCNLEIDNRWDLSANVKDMSKQLLACRFAKRGKNKFQGQSIETLSEGDKKQYEEVVQEIKEVKDKFFEKNIKRSVKQEIEQEVKQKFVSGISIEKLDEIISNTLTKTTESIEQYKKVNIGIIVVGAVLLLMSASVFLFWKTDPIVLGFGGFGLAGIIASLITNPTSSIGRTARQLIQIQIAYIGFLKQIDILKGVATENDNVVKKSECLEKTTQSLLKALCECFDAQDKDNKQEKVEKENK